ncbi:MAG: polysaccharide deacetylase family protein [Flavobacteriales bacterium]|nr:polysaccharide deacetylase family protein [Flavobacteriales bacterium]
MSGPAAPIVLVHLENPSPRARSVFQHLVQGLLGWSMREVEDPILFRDAAGPKLFYGGDAVSSALCLQACGILNEHGVRPWRLERVEQDDLPVILLDGVLDLPGAIFWLLSLYDELLPGTRDAHGRLPSSSRTVFKLALEHTPIVDRWALDLARRMRERWPALPAPDRRYAHHVTVDVDNGMRYLGRPLVRQLGASVKDVLACRFSELGERWQVVLGSRSDPYDRYEQVIRLCEGRASRRSFFFLLRGGTTYDHATSPMHPVMRSRIRYAAENAEVGIHPSYVTSDDAERTAHEIGVLGGIIDRPVRSSRQHFLRWRFPDTLHQLERMGIIEEHSIGASDRVGFTAGTCTPFPFYSIAEERLTAITLHPFALMDSALHDHLGLGVEQAFVEYAACIDAVRAVEGTLITVWHDRFLAGADDRQAWPALFERVVNAARP